MRARPGRAGGAQAVRRVSGAGAEGAGAGCGADAGHVREDGHGVRAGVLALVLPDPGRAAAGGVDGGGCAGVDREYDGRAGRGGAGDVR